MSVLSNRTALQALCWCGLALGSSAVPRARVGFELLARVRRAVGDWRAHRRRVAAHRSAIDALSGLNSATLQDLGMRTDDIEWVAAVAANQTTMAGRTDAIIDLHTTCGGRD